MTTSQSLTAFLKQLSNVKVVRGSSGDGETTSQPLTGFLEQSEELNQARATIYKPIDHTKSQIRLVYIHPAVAESDDVHLTVEVVSLDDLPTYRAISYTWGSRSTVAQVYLHNHAYNVTQNQFEALRRFRLTDRVQVMWMDVICINQDDTVERELQVGLMKRIYSSSQQTQIWLGELGAECSRGFTDEQWSKVEAWYWRRRGRDKMAVVVELGYENEEFSHRAERTAAFSELAGQPDGIILGAIRILTLLGSGIHYYELPSCVIDSSGEVQLYRPWFDSMQALKSMLGRPYWRRVWTVQEAILSPIDANVHIGRYEIPFSQFVKFGAATLKHAGTSVSCCGDLASMIMYEDDALDSDFLLSYASRFDTFSTFLHEPRIRGLSFNEALQLSNEMEAFDVRDYVYGVLGFVSYELGHIVDYHASASQVFQKATILCWLSRGSLGFLKKGSIDHGSRVANLPSWCIDFTDSETLGFKFYETFFEDQFVDWDNLEFDASTGSVVVQGLSVGSLKLCFERPSSPDVVPTDANLKLVTDWALQLEAEKVEASTELDPHTNPVFFRRFFDTIFRDTVFDMAEDAPAIRRLQTEEDWEEVEFWWEISSHGSAVAEWDHDRQNETRSRIRRTMLAFRLGLSDSTLAVTSNGQLSLVPLMARPDDQVYHITGCCMPLVLREVHTPEQELSDLEHLTVAVDTGTDDSTTEPVKPAARAFQVVGPCYIKGLMGSKVFEGLQTGPVTLV